MHRDLSHLRLAGGIHNSKHFNVIYLNIGRKINEASEGIEICKANRINN